MIGRKNKPRAAVAVRAVICLVLFSLTVLPGLFLALSAPDQAIIDKYFHDDDAYYYFKIAQNVSEGHGSTFDQTTRTNGYHPLWMWLLVPVFSLAKLNLVLPLRVVLVLCSLLHFGALTLILLALEQMGVDQLIGLGAGLLFVLSPAWNDALLAGTEMALNLFLVALFVFVLNRAFACLEQDLAGASAGLIWCSLGL